MMRLFAESTIEDSYIYKTFNSSNMMIEKIVKFFKTSTALDKSFIEEQYIQMKKLTISPLTSRVVDAYDKGDIELLYSTTSKVGLSIPFIIRRNQSGKIVASIFISTFSSIDKNDNLNIPLKQLYGLMESAYIALQLQLNPTRIQRNVALMKICALVYNQMFMKILNKDYALSLDKVLFDKVSYCIIRFFLDKIWEYPNKGLIDSYASNNLKYISDSDLDMVRMGYNDYKINTIEELLLYIKTISPRMNDLNIRYFIERFINTYHGSSIMSIDYLPYLFFVIVNILLGTFLISQTSLNDVVKNTEGITKFYSELSKLI